MTSQPKLPPKYEDGVQRKLRRLSSLAADRSTWEGHWADLGSFQSPRNFRLSTDRSNRGDTAAWSNIIDSRGLYASRVLAAGMMAGMTSPARPWFRLATPDTEMMEYAPVKQWLDETAREMRNVFARSNTYRVLHSMYRTLADFGTAVAVFDDDFDNVLHLTPLLTGQYYIATDSRNKVSTLYREYQMTVEQVVDTFGYKNCSASVQNLYDAQKYDEWIDVVHAVEPRRERDLTKIDARNMQYSSCYFEKNTNDSKYLRESGMRSFRVLAARWDVSGNDAYGFGPGSEALGHIKQLQQEQLRKAEAIDYQTKPPLGVPTSFKGADVNRLPGGITYIDNARGDAVKPLWDVSLNLEALLLDIGDVRSAIDSVYYADLFLLLANDTRSNVTAREVAERHEEKLLVLGPVLERLHNEMLSPLIDLTFERMQTARTASGKPILPPPPRELEGVDLNVEFVSTLAQAQRAVGVNSVDRLLGMVGAVAPLKPAILDKIDEDQMVDVYGDMLGVDQSIIRADEKVAEMRAAQAQQAQMQQMAAMAKPAADAAQAAKTASEIPDETQQQLNDVLSQFTGYSAPGQ